jgi:hypothetical protein
MATDAKVEEALAEVCPEPYRRRIAILRGESPEDVMTQAFHLGLINEHQHELWLVKRKETLRQLSELPSSIHP